MLYEIVLQCGTVSIPWIGLENTAFAMTYAKSIVDGKVYDDTVTAGLQGSQMRLAPSAMRGVTGFESFRATNPDSVHRTLYGVLKNFRGYKATDRRDMIFALVGMQHDTQDPIFIPNYHRPAEELYTLVSFFMITKYGFNILCEAGNQNRTIDDLPSWVIDWYVKYAVPNVKSGHVHRVVRSLRGVLAKMVLRFSSFASSRCFSFSFVANGSSLTSNSVGLSDPLQIH